MDEGVGEGFVWPNGRTWRDHSNEHGGTERVHEEKDVLVMGRGVKRCKDMRWWGVGSLATEGWECA